MAIDAREYEPNNNTQLPTIAMPLTTASRNVVRVRMPGRRKPNAAQINSSVPAPNTQRQNTTSSTGWPQISTNQPMVPEISMAAVISNDPRRSVLSIIRLLLRGTKYANPPGGFSSAKSRLNSASAFFIKALSSLRLTGAAP